MRINNKTKIIIGVLILIICILLFSFVLLPELEQKQVLDYKGEYRNDTVIMKTKFYSPVDGSTENQTMVGHFEEELNDPGVVGTRLKPVFIVKDERYNIYYLVG